MIVAALQELIFHHPDGTLDNDSPTNETRLINGDDGAFSHISPSNPLHRPTYPGFDNGGAHRGEKEEKSALPTPALSRAICRSIDSSNHSGRSGTSNGIASAATRKTTYSRAATRDDAAADGTAEGSHNTGYHRRFYRLR
ncbi:hypothetical protein EVAR_98544_1 [Eumeta japonica]|uniref:Uncharacterized protein n=1 Tax=Eumeta variegata TaxID=151549 RepID=A0A4C1YL36_EUMVA|nr:hypothetical protein EVAR_98544_1 [Eumeta japonica]